MADLLSPDQKRQARESAAAEAEKRRLAKIAARKLARDEDRAAEVDDRRDPLQVDPSVERDA